MYFTALGGGDEIGASCYLLEFGKHTILVDCGMRPNRRGNAAFPHLDRLPPKIDLILLTHAHFDHTGGLPLIRARYPKVPMLTSVPTKALTTIMLEDTVKIMQNQEGVGEPPYDAGMVDWTLRRLDAVPVNEWLSPLQGLRVCFVPCGHVLGACSLLIESDDQRVMVSGDISVVNQRTIPGLGKLDFRPDVLIMESTYGDGLHPKRSEEEMTLARSVAEVVARNGVALLPAFALGRAQEIILLLKDAQRSNVIPRFPIWVDGLVRSICDEYGEQLPYLSPSLRNYVANSRQPVFWSETVHRVMNAEERPFATAQPGCIITSSGMLTGGPSVYYARKLLPEAQNGIFFSGYTDEESPGRKLQHLVTGDTIELDGHVVPVNARVCKANLSAHADQGQICQQVSFLKPKAVLLVHGEGAAIQSLRSKLIDKHVVWIARNGQRIDPLSTPNWISERKAEVVAASSERYRGTMEECGGEIIIRLDARLADSALWQQYYRGYSTVEAKFMGTRLTVKAIPDNVSAPDEETPDEE